MPWVLYIVLGGFAVFVVVLGGYSIRDLFETGKSGRG